MQSAFHHRAPRGSAVVRGGNREAQVSRISVSKERAPYEVESASKTIGVTALALAKSFIQVSLRESSILKPGC